jgi:membrane-associated phospholipid phosphatase
MEKGQLEVAMNRQHTVVMDYFFQIATLFGDGIFAIPFIIFLLLFKNIYRSLVLAVSVLSTFVFIQLIKMIANMPRPLAYFPESLNLHYVEGLKIHSSYSFPSGHSAQAFSLFLILALFSKNKKAGWLFFLCALLTAISRMYLLQHFLMDTYFGALIASVITLITYNYFTNHTKLSERERWQKGLV